MLHGSENDDATSLARPNALHLLRYINAAQTGDDLVTNPCYIPKLIDELVVKLVPE